MSFWEDVHYKALVGSRGYGLATENSDIDYRGFFAPSTKEFLGLLEVPDVIDTLNPDITYWELKHYVKLLTKGNPNVLETLWAERYTTPIPQTAHIAESLRYHRSLFLSQKIAKPFGRFAMGQWERGTRLIQNGNRTAGFKALSHYFRLMISGTHAFLSGKDIMMDMGEYRKFLLGVKNQEFDMAFLEERKGVFEKRFKEAKETTNLPEEPDYEKVTELLTSFRLDLLNLDWRG